MEFRELTNQEFIDFTSSFKFKSIYQTPEYGFIMNNQGYDSIIVGLLDNGKIIAASLILIRKENGFKYAYSPRGFLLNYNDSDLLITFSTHLKKYLSKKGVMGIKINPMIIKSIYSDNREIKNDNYDKLYNQLITSNYYHLGYNNFFESLNPRFEAVIDLNKSIETLFNNVKKEYKTKVRNCYNNGIRIFKGNIDTIDEIQQFTLKKYNYNNLYFKDCFEFFSKRNMVDLYYTKLDTKVYLKHIQEKLSYYEEKSNYYNELLMKKHTNNDSIIKRKINIDNYLNQYQNDLVTATNYLKNYPDGIITAAIIIIKQNKEVNILIDSYDKRFKKLNSKHLLIWQLIEIYKKSGFTKFNLGGLSSITTTDNKYSGLNSFKIGFGADVYEYAGDFELITNRKNYELHRNFLPIKKLIDKLQ